MTAETNVLARLKCGTCGEHQPLEWERAVSGVLNKTMKYDAIDGTLCVTHECPKCGKSTTGTVRDLPAAFRAEIRKHRPPSIHTVPVEGGRKVRT